jgi:hypothetical protein
MRLTFAEEGWAEIVEELKPLILLQVSDKRLPHPRLALDLDYDGYAARSLAGTLHITTARDAETARLVGYFMNYVVLHPHYKTTLYGMMDTYFLAPGYRDAQCGMRLFMAMEGFLRGRGVTELIAQTKVKLDVSAMFDKLGWRRGAIVYAKSIALDLSSGGE